MEQSKFARVGLVLIHYRCIWPIIDQGSVQRSRSRTTQMIGSHPGCNWVIQAKPHWSVNVERRKYADHLLRPVSYFKRRRMGGNVRSWPSTPAEMPSVSLPSVLQLYGSPSVLRWPSQHSQLLWIPSSPVRLALSPTPQSSMNPNLIFISVTELSAPIWKCKID